MAIDFNQYIFPTPPSFNKIICLNCKSKYNPGEDFKFCPKCGTDLSPSIEMEKATNKRLLDGYNYQCRLVKEKMKKDLFGQYDIPNNIIRVQLEDLLLFIDNIYPNETFNYKADIFDKFLNMTHNIRPIK